LITDHAYEVNDHAALTAHLRTTAVSEELLQFQGRSADTNSMHTIAAQTRSTRKSYNPTADGKLVRRAAIAAAALYSILAAAGIAAAPELLNSQPLMFLWMLTMITAVATYITGHVLKQRNSDQP
jgi:hypothetical protein